MASAADPDGTKRRRVDSWSAPTHMHHVPYAAEQLQAHYANHSLPPPSQQPPYHEQDHRSMELPPPSPVHNFGGPPARYGQAPPPSAVSLPPPPPPGSAAGGPYQVDHQHRAPQHHHEDPSPQIKHRSPSDAPHHTLRPLTLPNNAHHPGQHQLDPHSAPPSYHDSGPPNGVSHSSMPLPAHNSEMPQSHARGYASSPVSAGGSAVPASAGGGASSGNRDYSYPQFGAQFPRRKAVRAAQACDACRARKAKCDEGRPSCGFCKESAIQCVYREVPPPKYGPFPSQDRTLGLILEGIRDIKAEIQEFREFKDSFPHWNASGPPRPSQRQSRDRERDSSMAEAEGPAAEEMKRGLSDQMEQSPGDRSSAGPALHQDLAAADVEVVAHRDEIVIPDEGEGELAIPIEHTTAAHKLLRWPSIRALVTPITDNENYVMQVEEKRGLLRVWGRGEGQDSGDVGGVGSGYYGDAPSPEGDELAFGSPTSYFQGPWGTGMMNPIPVDPRKLGGDCVGGLTHDGSLKLDSATLRYLLDSYLRNIHILHPFLDADRISHMFRVFSAKYGSSHPPSAARSPFLPPSVTPNQDGRRESLPSINRAGPKRKWSNANLAGPNSPGPGHNWPNAQGMQQAQARAPPERSIGSALVLLVLALGKICENGNWVPGPLPEVNKSTLPATAPASASPSFQHESPPVNIKQSPNSSHSSVGLNVASSPNERMPPASYPISPSTDRSSSKARNIDVIPGLAYYAYATDILGNLHGGHDLPHVQAGLLAGIYAGQQGRVMESWSWINWACTKCQILVHPQRIERETDAARKDLIIVAFWTCLQLESDILAELDLPPSGISRLEEKIRLPTGQSNLESEIWMYYYAQISLRRLLNRVHSAYHYKPEHKAANRTHFATRELEELQFQLRQWREALPERLRWKDSDPPPSEINAARLRAKYHGARYIIHRPFLHHVLHPIESGEGASSHQAVPSAAAPHADVPSPDRPDSAPSQPPTNPDALKRLDKGMVQACRNCLEAAIQSTEAFHGIQGRPIVTNIFGTAHAQFGNLLVLQAAARSPILSSLVPSDHLNNLLHRTVHFLRSLQDISPTLKFDATILESSILRTSHPPQMVNSSFSSSADGHNT